MSQTLPDWIGAHRRALDYSGCAPRVLVPDNLKSGVSKACKYEPELNPTYSDMAEYYGCAVLPARPRKPRDKAKVENGVLIAKRWILAVLRHRTFYSLAQLNAAIQGWPVCSEQPAVFIPNTRPISPKYANQSCHASRKLHKRAWDRVAIVRYGVSSDQD